ncbi:hypothetical protein LJC36_02425 [Desulfovibrio sp. OttesenSCG-928-C14]|nr:hypothetical protein [Desulfovibrio sp. OttesenSCG-928-C14]
MAIAEYMQNFKIIKFSKGIIMRRILFPMLLLLLFVLPGCNGSDIDIVKNGKLSLDKSVTVGNVIDNYQYFSSTKWSEFEDKNKRRIVQVEGTISVIAYAIIVNRDIGPVYSGKMVRCIENKGSPYYTDKLKCTIQFRILEGDKFEVSYCGIGESGQEYYKSFSIIEDIYRDKFLMSISLNEFIGMCNSW